MNLLVRPYDPADLDSLYAIDQACYPPGIAYSRRTLRWFLRLPGAECWVAAQAERVVGFILTEAESLRAHIITLDVSGTHRRRGIGSALLLHAEQRLAARGVQRIELETATDNHAAVVFWQKHGYRTRGVLPRYYLGRTDALWMDKPLAPASAHLAGAVSPARET